MTAEVGDDRETARRCCPACYIRVLKAQTACGLANFTRVLDDNKLTSIVARSRLELL